jgi:histidinol-phosphate aminotransferase
MSLKEKVARLLRPEVRALSAYHVQPAAGLLKLDAMENPYTWPLELQRRWSERLQEVPLNRYPDATAEPLKRKLRTAFGIPDDMAVMLGNGSDEVIQVIIMALARPGAVVAAPEPTFVMYRGLALALGAQFTGVPLKPVDFSLDEQAMLDVIRERQPAVTFLAWPNNPTGNLFDEEAVIRIIAASPGLVVVDEAYFPFARKTFMDRLAVYDNLLVMRTLSKQGLAGLRLGFLAGRPEWLDEFDKLRLPYNINALTQMSVAFILDHKDVLDDQAALIRQEREVLLQDLQSLPGIMAWPSAANFILIRSDTRPGPQVHAGLKEQGVLIKDLHGSSPMLENCLRVTVSTPEENGRFLEALKAVL